MPTIVHFLNKNVNTSISLKYFGNEEKIKNYSINYMDKNFLIFCCTHTS